MSRMDRTRPFLTMLVILLLGAGIGGAIAIPTTTRVVATATAFHPASLRVTAAPTTTTTTSPPAPPAAAATGDALAADDAATDGPIDAPADGYASEPIHEIGTIDVPKLGLHHRVMEGITLHNIDLGPSHWPGTALPGQPGNAVFAGHRVTHTHPFRNIDQLAV